MSAAELDGVAQPNATTFAGRLSVAWVAGLRPDGSTFSTSVHWRLVDLELGHVLDDGGLWSESGLPRTAKIAVAVSGTGLVGLTLCARWPPQDHLEQRALHRSCPLLAVVDGRPG